MPERWKQRRGSLQLTSVTMTRFAPACPALSHHFGDQFRIGVGGLLGRAIPGDVGLDDNDILSRDESAHAAEVFKSLLHERAGLAGLRHRVGRIGYCATVSFGHSGIGCDAMIFAGLFGMRRNGPRAALTEPEARRLRRQRRCRPRAATAAGFAAREAGRLRGAGCALFAVSSAIGLLRLLHAILD